MTLINEIKSQHINKVELLGTYGGDTTHALSAWTSTSRDLDIPDKKGVTKRERIPNILKMLAENHHETPFEKSTIHFLVTTDIATHIHIIKHRIGVSCITGDTLISIPRPGGGFKKKAISTLYEEYTKGILSTSKNGKVYNRKYGRPTPIRTKAENSNLVQRGYIKSVFKNGKKEVFCFSTAKGKKIKSTLDHKFFTPEGFVEIGSYLNVKNENGVATFSNKGMLVATNGINLNVPGKPYTFRDWWEKYENTHTRMEVAKITGMEYNNVKKWGYIHNIAFKQDENKDFKKGNVPWNKSRYGYSVNRQKRGINPNINPNLTHKIWRATVGNWTQEQLPALLNKFGYVCQAQLGICSRDFVGHHIIPVSVDPSLATDFENLSLVCRDCHKRIHSTREAEIKFAEQVKKQDLKKTFSNRKPRVGKKLAFDFEEIVKVEYAGVEEVYDLEVANTHCYVANGFLIHNCNGESARYKELKDDKFFVPQDWPESEVRLYVQHLEHSLRLYHGAMERLVASGMTRTRAKESARFYLPYGNQIQADVMFNFRSFYHFLSLRYSTHAQKEVRDLAFEMLKAVDGTGDFEQSLRAFKLKTDEGLCKPFA